jgi:hypothetical protein
VRSAERITGGKLPDHQDTYSTRCHKKAKKIIKDINQPSHDLFTLLSSRRQGQYRCIKAGNKRLIDYVIVRRSDTNDVLLTCAMRGAECWRDPRMILAKLQLRIRPPNT